MSKLIEKYFETPLASDDGFDQAAADAASRIVRGTLLKFSDGRWSKGKEGIPVADGAELVALSTAYGWVKWVAGKPEKYVMREPGKRLADRDELGDLDEAGWEDGPSGEPRDPWQESRFLYLVEQDTAESFTFSTSTWTGREAIVTLADQIALMRRARPNVVPVVALGSAPIQTRFGRKSKPVLQVMRWHGGDVEPAPPRQLPETTFGSEPPPVETDDEFWRDFR